MSGADLLASGAHFGGSWGNFWRSRDVTVGAPGGSVGLILEGLGLLFLNLGAKRTIFTKHLQNQCEISDCLGSGCVFSSLSGLELSPNDFFVWALRLRTGPE